MRTLFAVFALCVCFGAHAFPKHFHFFMPSAREGATFSLGEPIEGVDGGYEVKSFSAFIGQCPSFGVIDPITGRTLEDCKYGVANAAFNVLTNSFFSIDAFDQVPYIDAYGHGRLYLHDDGTYLLRYSTNQGLVEADGTFSFTPLPEPTAAALLVAPGLALWILRRRKQ